MDSISDDEKVNANVLGNYDSKVEVFNPDEFENDSQYSDESISKSMKKKKRHLVHDQEMQDLKHRNK
jgi:hypothetical protein